MCPVGTKFFHVDGWIDMIKKQSLFTIFLMCLEIIQFRASAGRKITKQPILVKVQGTVCLTGNYTAFLTEIFLLCGVTNYIPSSLQYGTTADIVKNPLLGGGNSVCVHQALVQTRKKCYRNLKKFQILPWERKQCAQLKIWLVPKMKSAGHQLKMPSI